MFLFASINFKQRLKGPIAFSKGRVKKFLLAFRFVD